MAGYAITITVADQASKRIDAINKKIAEIRAPMDRLNKSMARFFQVTGLEGVIKKFADLSRGAAAFAMKLLEVIPALAAITGAGSIAGLYALAQRFGDVGVRLGLLSTRLGVTGTGLQQLENIGRRANVPVEALDEGLVGLRDTMADVADGRAPEALIMMRKLGFSLRDAAQFAKDPIRAFPLLAQRIQAASGPWAQLTIASQLFGGSAAALLPLLRTTAEEFRRSGDAVQRHGLMTAGGIAAAASFRLAETDLTESVEGLGFAVGTKLIPTLVPVLNRMSDWIDRNREWMATQISDKVQALVKYLQSLDWNAISRSIGNMAANFEKAATWVAKYHSAIIDGLLIYEGVKWTSSVAGLVSMARKWTAFGEAATGAGQAGAAAIDEMGGMAGIAALLARLSPLGLAAILKGDTPRGGPGQAGGPSVFEAYDPYRARDGGGGRGGQWWNPASWDWKPFISHMTGGDPADVGQHAARPADIGVLEDYFRGQGWTKEQVAGILGNFQGESGMDLANVGDMGAARGLGQWRDDRLKQYKAMFGHDPTEGSTLEQAQFTQWELTHTESEAGKALARAKTAAQAGAIFSMTYERPQASELNAQTRAGYAENWLKQMMVPQAAGPNLTLNSSGSDGNGSKDTLKGSVAVNVRLAGAPPGTTVVSQATGPIMQGAPRVELGLPAMAGP